MRMWMGLAAAVLGVAMAMATGAAVRGAGPEADYSAEFERSEKYAGARTEAELGRIEKALAVAETRMAALRELIDFAGLSTYNGRGSIVIVYQDHSEEIRRRAADLAHAAADDATVRKALEGTDALLRYWGIQHFSAIKDAAEELPVLERMAQGRDETLRCSAVERLRGHDSERAFVRDLAGKEKSPYVLDAIMYGGATEKAVAFNRRLCEVLGDADAAARKKVVNYIGVNSYSAAARQMVIDASIMEGLLGCAQSKQPEAEAALNAFRMYASQRDLTDAAAAATWWKGHRGVWELARFPRGTPANGGQIYASIVTTGRVGAKSGWQASITLENRGKNAAHVNMAEVAGVNWSIYAASGERVQLDRTRETVAPEWRVLKPGETVTRDAAIKLAPGALLAPGRYMLRACLNLGGDQRERPENVAVQSGEIPLPAIIVEAVKGEW